MVNRLFDSLRPLTAAHVEWDCFKRSTAGRSQSFLASRLFCLGLCLQSFPSLLSKLAKLEIRSFVMVEYLGLTRGVLFPICTSGLGVLRWASPPLFTLPLVIKGYTLSSLTSCDGYLPLIFFGRTLSSRNYNLRFQRLLSLPDLVAPNLLFCIYIYIFSTWSRNILFRVLRCQTAHSICTLWRN